MSLWQGELGDAYTKRNTRETAPYRLHMWQHLLPDGVETILEVGANIGLNLEAIGKLNSTATLCACEPNEMARAELVKVIAPECVSADFADDIGWPDNSFDLVFTSGVLIHIAPNAIEDSIKEIHRVAKRYIIIGEYFAPSEEMVPYRGHRDALWRRDYGSMFLDLCPDLVSSGVLFAWKRTTGLDNLTFWIFEKGPMRN